MDNTTAHADTLRESDTFVGLANQPDGLGTDISGDDIDIARSHIEQTRANMGETLAAIQEKLNPQTLMDQAKTTLHAVTADVMGQAKSAVQDVSGNLTSTVHTIVSDVSDHAKETAKDAATGAISGAVGEVKDAVGGAVTATKEAVGTAYDTTMKAGTTLMDMAKNNPLPTLLLLGAGWWLLSNRSDSSRRSANRQWESNGPNYGNGNYRPYASAEYSGDYRSGNRNEESGVVGTLIETAKRNPIPAALLVGTALHFYQGAQHSESGASSSLSKTAEGISGAVSQTLNAAGEKAGDAVESAKGAIGDAVEGAKDAVGSAVGSVKGALDSATTAVKQSAGQATQTANEWVGTVSESARSAGTSLLETIRENPLPAAAWALGIGVTIALLLPDTEPENRLLGKTRDNLINTAQESANQLLDKVQNVSSKTFEAVTDTVKQEAQSQGLTV